MRLRFGGLFRIGFTIQRLAQLATVAVQGIGFRSQLPAKRVSRFEILDCGFVREIDRLGDRSGYEWLCGRHHADMPLGENVPFSDLTAAAGAVEDRQMFGLKMGSTFDRHPAANRHIGFLCLLSGESQRRKQIEIRTHGLRVGKTKPFHGFLAERPFVESEPKLKYLRQVSFDHGDIGIHETLRLKTGAVYMGRTFQAECPHDVPHDFGDLIRGITQRIKSRLDGLIGDLHVSAAGQFLELHQREVRLDAGGVAIHQESDGSGRSDHRHLGVAVAGFLSHLQRPVPGFFGRAEQIWRTNRRVQADGFDAEILVFGFGCAVCRQAVISDHPQHVFAVPVEALERTERLGHFGRSAVSVSGHYRGECAGDGPPQLAVIRDPHLHEQGSEICITESQSAEFVAQPRDLLARKLGHQNRNLQYHGPEPDGMAVLINGKILMALLVGFQKLQKVYRGEIAGGVIQKHVFAAGIAGIYPPVGRTGVPLVYRRIVLHAGIGACPGGISDIVPEFAGFHLPAGFWRPVFFPGFFKLRPPKKLPVFVAVYRLQKFLRYSDGIVGILSRNCGIRFPVEIRRVTGLRQCRHFFLFIHLPVHKFENIRMINVQTNHFGRPAGGSAGFYGSSGAVADFQEAHQARGLAAAR